MDFIATEEEGALSLLKGSVPMPDDLPYNIGLYKPICIIGEGSYGRVLKVVHRYSRKEFACKVVSRQQFTNDPCVLQCFEQEIRIHERLYHPNIANIIEIIYEKDYIFVILELCSKGSLFDCLSKPAFSYSRYLKRIAYQLVDVVDFIHTKGVVHYDIKPENILLDEEMNVKLADFGCAHEMKKVPTCLNGTLGYAAPELLSIDEMKVKDIAKPDIWSIGITIFTLATGHVPWKDVSTFYKMVMTTPNFFEEKKHMFDDLSPEISEFVSKCLQVDPMLRPSAAQLKKIEWFKDIEKFGILRTSSYCTTSDDLKDDPENIRPRKTPSLLGKVKANSLKDEGFRKKLLTFKNRKIDSHQLPIRKCTRSFR